LARVLDVEGFEIHEIREPGFQDTRAFRLGKLSNLDVEGYEIHEIRESLDFRTPGH